jgi:hypothetical protein
MGPFLKAHGLRVVLTAVVIYLVFFLSLGTRTFFQHVRRIVTTPEAKELSYELTETLGSAALAVTRKIRGDRPPY